MHEILLGLTTTPKSNWREKVEEIKRFNIEKVALFLTGIGKEERKELYDLLTETNLKSVPHIHLRNDMNEEEINYLISKYNTSLFNIHPQGSKHSFKCNFTNKFDDRIYVENLDIIPTQNELDEYAGLCIDFSHWEHFGRGSGYAKIDEILKNNKIGCCHVSAVRNFMWGFFPVSFHYAKGNKDFNYLKKYARYLPEFISLELENSFEEQLKFKKYIEENILGIK